MRPPADIATAAPAPVLLHVGVDPSTLHLPLGCAGDELDQVALTPERIGFRLSGLRVVDLAPGETRRFECGEHEYAIVPISGGDVSVEVEGSTEIWQLAGRTSVFEGVPDVAAVSRDVAFTLVAGDAPTTVALAHAHARRQVTSTVIRAADVPVEVRGAGVATRQLNNLFAPGIGPFDRLTVVEGLVPGGNWASWPPHKHDEPGAEAEAVLEEIYWFRVRGEGGWATHRTYDLDEGWDVTVTIRDGDAFLVPRGFHGPEMATPGHDLYFLNVLAGPGAERSLAFTDDPAHAGVRAAWQEEVPDPRVPLTRA